MAYDAARGRMVLFGGALGSDILGDTWEWDGQTWQQLASTGPHERFNADSVDVFAISPDAGRFAIANKAGLIRILDAATGEELIVFQGPAEPVDIDWSPDGDQLAVLSYRTALQLWDIAHFRS